MASTEECRQEFQHVDGVPIIVSHIFPIHSSLNSCLPAQAILAPLKLIPDDYRFFVVRWGHSNSNLMQYGICALFILCWASITMARSSFTEEMAEIQDRMFLNWFRRECRAGSPAGFFFGG